MDAKVSPFVGKYSILADVVPLSAPYNVTISTGNICDFHCNYCIAKDIIKNERERPHLTSLDEFQIIISQLKEFEEPVRTICFVSTGETILNRNLPEMIRQIKQEKVAEKVKITTNANMLTPEYSDQLIDAGLDILKVSLQGLSDEDYERTCHPSANFSFERLKKQIQYFYSHRENCKVYLKIIDVALRAGEEQTFYDMFGSMADNIFIERCLDKNDMNDRVNKYQNILNKCDICPTPFYYMGIDVWGNVFPCCASNMTEKTEAALGNIHRTSLKNLWQNSFKELQISLLRKQLTSESECYNCKSFRAIEKEINILDGRENEIFLRYQ